MSKETTWEEFFEAIAKGRESGHVFFKHPPMMVWRAIDPYTFGPKLVFLSEDGKQYTEIKIGEEAHFVDWKDLPL